MKEKKKAQKIMTHATKPPTADEKREKKVETPSAAETSAQENKMAKLYVVTDCGVYLLPLDIGKLRNRDNIPPKPKVSPPVKFEKLWVDDDKVPLVGDEEDEIPCFLHPIEIDDNVLLVGGWLPHPSSVDVIPNTNIAYMIANDRLKPIPSPLRSFHPDLGYCLTKLGLAKHDVFLYQFRSSIYVLDASDPEKPSFCRYELNSLSKEVLPGPPDNIRVLDQTGWDHKFHIITTRTRSTSSSSRRITPSLRNTPQSSFPSLYSQPNVPVGYDFDLVEERWYRCRQQFRAAVIYQGFLIGLIPSGKIVCCPMDDEVTPRRELHDLFDICMLLDIHIFKTGCVLMGLYRECEDDYICLAYTLKGLDAGLNVHVYLVLFRVFIQNGVIHTIVEASHCYYFSDESTLCTAFIRVDPPSDDDEIMHSKDKMQG